jgi:putative ABC transport system permease protein
MIVTLSLAWRNLLRNRRRSLMTLLAMLLGLMAVLLFGGYIRDITYSLQTNFVVGSGHLQIQHRDYFRLGTGNPAAYGVKDYDRIIRTLQSDPEVGSMLVVATPSLQFGAIAGNFAASVSRTVYVTGVVVDDQNRMRQWNDYGQRNLSSRNLSLSGTPENTAIIGTGLARVLKLCAQLSVANCEAEAAPDEAAGAAIPSDIAALAGAVSKPAAVPGDGGRPRIEILAASPRGAPNVAEVQLLAAEFQGVKELDDVYVALHLAQAQKLVFGASKPKVTAIALQLQHTAQLPAAHKRIQEVLAQQFADQPLVVLDYQELNPFYGQTLAMFRAIFGFISILMGSIVLFTVSNTMSMAVVERTSEIGTLRAIGLRQSGIRSIFLCEGLLLGCMGAVIGILLSLIAAAAINRMDLTWVPPGRIEQVPLAVRLAGENSMLILSAMGLIIVAALSALVPAARASRMNIVDALRHV